MRDRCSVSHGGSAATTLLWRTLVATGGYYLADRDVGISGIVSLWGLVIDRALTLCGDTSRSTVWR